MSPGGGSADQAASPRKLRPATLSVPAESPIPLVLSHGRPPSGSTGSAGAAAAFDVGAAEQVDLATICAVLCYLLVYSVGFNSAYRVWRAKRRSGAQRSWAEGPEQRNRWPVTEGYRLRLNDAFAARHGKNFLGAGDVVRTPASQF